VGQATLSRDIHELNLVKTADGYARLQVVPAGEPALPPVSRLGREFVLDVRPAQNLLVIKTAVGSAQPVAAALDAESWPETVGTIAGDDAILIVCPDQKSAGRLAARIREMLG
jgi:transcriptional regulator of arginine metabolism